MPRISLSIKELQQAGVPKWCTKLVADSMLSLYKRKDGKSPFYYLKFDVPEPLQAKLGKVKRVSTEQTDKELARKAALRKVVEWCAPLLEPTESPVRPLVLVPDLIEELCRARRDATMWSAEDDVNVFSYDGLSHVVKDDLSDDSPVGENMMGTKGDASKRRLPPGLVKNNSLSEHFAEWEGCITVVHPYEFDRLQKFIRTRAASLPVPGTALRAYGTVEVK